MSSIRAAGATSATPETQDAPEHAGLFAETQGGAPPRARRPLGRILGYLALAVTTAISLFPMYWLLLTAFTPTESSIKIPPDFLPVHASLDNFSRLFRQSPDIWRWTANSLIIALSVTVFHVLFDTLSAYAFAKKQFPGRNLFFWMILSTLMIPPQVTLVPLYLAIRQLGLVNNVWAVILPGWADVFGIFLMRQFIQTLPTELEEAARIDGASEPGIFWRIIVPLSRPALGALAIFTFVHSWNTFLWPLIVLQRTATMTLPVGVASLQNEFAVDYGLIFAGAAIAAVPMILFFLVFQRQFIEGVRIGALKG
ncbi:MAG TPA: carbohydrate ABC transporter permease [Chloroflexia bacterium]|nr:carbohydrate ABC transporter permease [Chloroflexia bacterium]